MFNSILTFTKYLFFFSSSIYFWIILFTFTEYNWLTLIFILIISSFFFFLKKKNLYFIWLNFHFFLIYLNFLNIYFSQNIDPYIREIPIFVGLTIKYIFLDYYKSFFFFDSLSFSFIGLSLVIFLLSFIYLYNDNNINLSFLFFFFILELLILCAFLTTDIFFFYIFFEATLIPLIFIILNWGSQVQKIKALYLLILYTAIGSILFLLGISYLFIIYNSTNIFFCSNFLILSENEQILLSCLFIIAFSIKIPMFPFHIWLPEAHVEAPTLGSVILASILLKFGSYGFLRFIFLLLPKGCLYFSSIILTFSLLGIIYSTFIVFQQIDFKRIIAYASISHMNFVLAGLFTCSFYGLLGSLIQSIAHGFSSAALFLSIGFLYSKYKIRLISYYSGLTLYYPKFGLFIFVFILANIGFPLTFNFIGELFLILSLFTYSKILGCIGIFSTFFTLIYSFFFLSKLIFGTFNKNLILSSYLEFKSNEFFVFCFFLFFILSFGLYPKLFLDFNQYFFYFLFIRLYS